MIDKLLISGALVLSLVGCGIRGLRAKSGNSLNEANARQIVNDKITASEVLGLFGLTAQTTTQGGNAVKITIIQQFML